MGLTLTATQAGTDQMWRRGKKGLELVEVDRSRHISPPVGMKARFLLSGISEPFQLKNNFSDDPDAMKTMIRIEFTVEQGADKDAKPLEGRAFTALYGYSLNPKANLAKLVGAIRGEAVEMGDSVDLDSFIGCSFVSKTLGQQNDPTKFGRVSTEIIDAGKVKWPNGTATAAARDNDTADEGDDDPFEDDL